jgi:hypothetical protein
VLVVQISVLSGGNRPNPIWGGQWSQWQFRDHQSRAVSITTYMDSTIVWRSFHLPGSRAILGTAPSVMHDGRSATQVLMIHPRIFGCMTQKS